MSDVTVARHIKLFLRNEEGSLLVFFMVSTITVLGIVALSFDLGRRASTQTDMQSYVDNVVLAAAGELDGSVDAIANATRAANTVISAANDRLKAGTAGQDLTIALSQIVFYEDLPDVDTPASFDSAQLSNPASSSYKYRLPVTDLGASPDPTRARYVGIQLATVDVPWIFAGVFSSSDLPGNAIGATAIAGNSVWACDIAPVMFCLPSQNGQPQQLFEGQAMRLRPASATVRWRAGFMGYSQVDVDPTGPCVGLTNAARQGCLLTAQTRIAACMQPNETGLLAGLASGMENSPFDMSFDIYDQSMIAFFNEQLFAPGPHTIRGRVPASGGDICAPTETSDNTMAFPLDDCFSDGDCDFFRFGDGDWSEGREEYVETNYSFEDGGSEEIEDGEFFDFPEPNLTRYEFYLREIERAQNGGVMNLSGGAPYDASEHLADNDGLGEEPEDYTTWDDFWPDTPTSVTGLNPIIPHADRADDNGLPQCNQNLASTPDPNRRVFLAAGIHCPTGSEQIRGNETGVPIVDFYRVFQLGPTDNVFGFPPRFDLSLEVVERIDPAALPTRREVVQLYK